MMQIARAAMPDPRSAVVQIRPIVFKPAPLHSCLPPGQVEVMPPLPKQQWAMGVRIEIIDTTSTTQARVFKESQKHMQVLANTFINEILRMQKAEESRPRNAPHKHTLQMALFSCEMQVCLYRHTAYSILFVYVRTCGERQREREREQRTAAARSRAGGWARTALNPSAGRERERERERERGREGAQEAQVP